MENQFIKIRETLKEALKTVNYQIKMLKPYYSRPQVRCWYVRRRQLKEKLRYVEACLQPVPKPEYKKGEYLKRLIQKNETRKM